MTATIVIIGIVALGLGFAAGYLFGWRDGHLTGVRYTLGILVTDIDDDIIARYTRDTIDKERAKANGRWTITWSGSIISSIDD